MFLIPEGNIYPQLQAKVKLVVINLYTVGWWIFHNIVTESIFWKILNLTFECSSRMLRIFHPYVIVVKPVNRYRILIFRIANYIKNAINTFQCRHLLFPSTHCGSSKKYYPDITAQTILRCSQLLVTATCTMLFGSRNVF